MKEYPYNDGTGRLIWACCESVIHPRCKHWTGNVKEATQALYDSITTSPLKVESVEAVDDLLIFSYDNAEYIATIESAEDYGEQL